MKPSTLFRSTTVVAACLGLALTIGCSPKPRKAGGQMDDPPTHCKEGMKYWDNGQFAKAEEEFNLAKSLDPKYAPAYSGLALVTAEKALSATTIDQMKTLFDEAVKLADKAQGLDSKIATVYIAKGIVLTLKNQGKPAKEWLSDVEDQYNKAIKIDPNSAESYYRRGVCYKKAYEFSKASADFKKVLDLNNAYTIQANAEWELVQKIERAAPGTDVGRKIALVDKISRADVCALYVSELAIDKLVQKKRPKIYDNSFQAPADKREMKADSVVSMKAVTDIDTSWAKNFVLDIVELKIRGLEPYPDHTFHPQELVNRGEFAMMVEDAIIAILGDPTLATKHIGTQSRFPDVNPSHPSYNAICNAVDKNVLDAAMNGEFGPDKSVSGPDALLAIRALKDLNKIQ
jgi:Tfp pilus assembly protein PilF